MGSANAPLDPCLAALADNGGPTKTHLLQSHSLAINAAGTDALGTDQRGAVRTVGAAMDIGAVEVAADALAADVIDAIAPNIPPGLPPNPNIPVVDSTPPGLPANPKITPSRLDTLLATIPDRNTDLTKVILANSGSDRISQAVQTESQSSEDNAAIRRLERTFSQGFEDYWDLAEGRSLSFDDIQAILRRAQEEYQVNSAVIYAIFKPEEESENKNSDLLQVELAPSPDDLLNLSLVLPGGELVSYELPVTRLEATQQISLFRSMVSDS